MDHIQRQTLGRRFKNRDHAMRALKAINPKYRAYRVEGENVSAVEKWLCTQIVSLEQINPGKGVTRKYLRELIGIARSLDLYPIPDWMYVLDKLQKSSGQEGFFADYDRFQFAKNFHGFDIQQITFDEGTETIKDMTIRPDPTMSVRDTIKAAKRLRQFRRESWSR